MLGFCVLRNLRGRCSRDIGASGCGSLFRGRILTGGDTPWAFLASLTVVLGITGVWFGTTCVWWWRNESPAVAGVGTYMCLLTISSMCATVRFVELCPVQIW